MIRGIIFDMDGVLLNSEPATAIASVKAMREFGLEVQPKDFYEYAGMGEVAYFGGVAEKYGGTYDENMSKLTYRFYLAEGHQDIILFDQVPEIIRTLHARGYKIAIASGSLPVKVNANIQFAGLPRDCFNAIVTAADVSKQKPDPEIFLTAAGRMGLSPEECIVCEDAVSGVTGAIAGGMQVLGITTTFPAERLTALGARWTSDHIRQLLELLPDISQTI